MLGAKHFAAHRRPGRRRDRRRHRLRAGGGRGLRGGQGRGAAAHRAAPAPWPTARCRSTPATRCRWRRASSPASARSSSGCSDEHGEHEHLGWTYLTPTVLLAGDVDQINVIPARATVCVDIRTIPGVDHAAMVEAVTRDGARGRRAGSGVRVGVEVRRRPAAGGHPAWTTRWWPRWPRRTSTSSGEPAVYGGVPGATDGTILTRDAGLATVVYGPGGKWIAHQADEFVEVADIVRVRQGLRRGGPAVPDREHRMSGVRPGPTNTPRPTSRHPGRATHRGAATAGCPARRWCSHRTGGAVGGVDVRGGGPGTRETDLLDPRNAVERVHAVVLTGGSAFGLAAADGVMQAGWTPTASATRWAEPARSCRSCPARWSSTSAAAATSPAGPTRPSASEAYAPPLSATGAEAVPQGCRRRRHRRQCRAAQGRDRLGQRGARRRHDGRRAGRGQRRRVDRRPRDRRAVRARGSASTASSRCWQRRRAGGRARRRATGALTLPGPAAAAHPVLATTIGVHRHRRAP